MSDFLRAMCEVSAARARVARESANVADLRRRVASASPPLALELSARGFDVIAEAKLASPAEGILASGGSARVVSLARSYVAGGAAAISVLTEEMRFAGSIDHLEAVAGAVDAPVMRKDFLVDPIQVEEARAAGASGVLLIARALPDDRLVEMTDLALEMGMFVLVEVFDRSDLETAAVVFDRDVMVGVNGRDLSSLHVDADRFGSLAPLLPGHLVTVAESGILSPGDAATVARLGYRLALVGTALVRHDEPGSALAAMIEAGRAAHAGAGR